MNTPILACLLSVFLLTACAGQAIQRKDGSSSVRGFSIRDLAKSDVDSVVEIHQQEVIAILKTLTAKLYRCNPGEWKKSGYRSADAATHALFKALPYWQLSSQKNLGWAGLLTEAGQQTYAGDRVKAMMNGLLVMNMAAYNHQTEFYLLSEMDAQKFYNAARNIEYVAWELATHRDQNSQPLLASSQLGDSENRMTGHSLEREFGKLIGLQDTLAKIIEDKNNRAIRFSVVNAAGSLFLPI
ncbi:MAG: hypothetical protein Q7U80_05565 [Thiobacillus sp.]|nr:hypothetical protein [Thiobacillus sp.]